DHFLKPHVANPAIAMIWNREFSTSELQSLYQLTESCTIMNGAAIQGDDDTRDEHVKGFQKTA
ncbi:MAG: hypothetical protein ACFFAZ_04370, partial [Promethearchaeota archaeon]